MKKPSTRSSHVNPQPKPPGYLTVRQATRLAECSAMTIWRLIQRRRVRVIRWRSRVLLSEADLCEWSRVRRYRRRPRRRSAVPPPSELVTQPITTQQAGVSS